MKDARRRRSFRSPKPPRLLPTSRDSRSRTLYGSSCLCLSSRRLPSILLATLTLPFTSRRPKSHPQGLRLVLPPSSECPSWTAPSTHDTVPTVIHERGTKMTTLSGLPSLLPLAAHDPAPHSNHPVLSHLASPRFSLPQHCRCRRGVPSRFVLNPTPKDSQDPLPSENALTPSCWRLRPSTPLLYSQSYSICTFPTCVEAESLNAQHASHLPRGPWRLVSYARTGIVFALFACLGMPGRTQGQGRRGRGR
ncbi:hypothetical protein R3P38DRAFT_1550420 [Favolaschia claudopus]|uniref:Uncharacterized protein n=1 Tax=Favolaschia claudopus TaxID=2862362 RepID=A0AAW0AJ71_9AGAR